jgi:hypothetical protein
LGETFSFDEAAAMLDRAGLTLLMAEGPGTQYFILTARKAPPDAATGPRPYVFPGEPWAPAQLIEGWGDAVDRSWRRAAPLARAVLRAPGPAARFFLGLYFWPGDAHREHTVEVFLEGRILGSAVFASPGDHYLELPAPLPEKSAADLRLAITPPCEPPYAPAVRCLGLYVPTSSLPAPAMDRSPA